MAGYVRQSAADIVPTGVVRAAPINNELNALRDAFVANGGHRHDGTAAEGHPVPVIGDADLLNKIATDTANNRHGVFVEVGAAAVEQVRFQDGAIVPVTDNDVDLGTSALEFKDLHIDGTANIDSLVADTADINGGTVDSAVIGATTPAAATVTNLTVNTAATIASADINAGTIDGTVIGGAAALAITGTTVTATTGFVGGLTGAVTGNTTGTHTGAVVGNVTGNLTGNVTASTGTSTFNDVTINGGLNMDAATAATITNLTSPTNSGDAATKGYVDTADALKLNLSGGTMSGVIAMGTSKITGLGDPTLAQDAATKTYVDTADALKLNLAGGTMSGAIAMGTSKITGLGDPTANQDAATKVYVDTSISNLVAAAPGALDTLDELAAALGDDANFATTVTNSIATKLALAGGTMSGAIAMGTNKITGVGNPTLAQDAATKTYVDTADALKLNLSGGTMSGAIAMGTSQITGLGNPTLAQDAATKTYVDTADALKLNLAGGTMSGAIAMGTSKITGMGDPTANQDAATKVYVDTADALKLSLTGGTMSGAIAMGTSKITGLGDPTTNQDAATKVYVDGILGSSTAAAASASAAATSASNAATSASNASTSASNASSSASAASTSATNAAASYDSFDDRYLGSKASAPSVDNDGNTLLVGALYWNSTSNELYLWTGSAWTQAALTAGSFATLTGTETLTNKTLTSPILTTPALGTPSSGVVTNLTGTASININGTVGATTATTGAFTTLSTSGRYTVNNGVRIAGGATLGATEFGLFSYDSPNTRFFIGDGTGYNFIFAKRASSTTTDLATFTDTGNLGIGTTSPALKLHISSATTDDGIRIQNTSAASSTAKTTRIAFYGTDTGSATKEAADIYTLPENANYINTALTFHTRRDDVVAEKLRIDSSGNVGIGATSPAYKLDIRQATNADVYINLQNATAGYASALTLSAANSAGASYNAISSYDGTSNQWQIGGFGTANTLAFKTGGSEGMRLTSTGLGIGTSSPSNKLEVAGNVGITLTSSVGFIGFKNNSTTTTEIHVRPNSGKNGLISFTEDSVDDRWVFGIKAGNGSLFFNTGTPASNTDRMVLNSSGNLGIGTSSPSTRLHLYTAASATTLTIDSGTSGTALVYSLAGVAKYTAEYVSASNFYAIGRSAVAYDLVLSGGNVGIGTTSPGQKLEVSGGNIRVLGSSTARITFNNGTTEAYVGFNGAGGTVLDSGALPLSINTQGANIVTLATNSTTRFQVGALGQFGIGGANYGTSGQVLTSGGASAAPTWTTVSGGSGSPGGSNTQVQFNNSGAFGGSANFTFNGSGITTGFVNVNASTPPTAGMYYNSTATSGLSFYNTGSLGGNSALQIYHGRSTMAASTGGIDNAPTQWYAFGAGTTPQLTIGSTASKYTFQGHGYRLDEVPYVFTIQGGSRGDNGSYTVPESNGILYIEPNTDYGGNGSTGRNCIYVKNDATGFGTSTNGVKVVNNFYGRQNAFYALLKIGDPNGGGQNFGFYAQTDTSNGANDNAAPVGLVVDNATVDNYTKTNGNAQMAIFYDRRSGSTTRTAIQFYRNTTSNSVGTITTTNTATAYNTSSDYRLKENIAPLTGAIEKVLRLKPSTYTWKVDGSAGEGFIAHELQAVIPQAVSGEKDAEKLQQVEVEHAVPEIKDDDGNIISYGKSPVYEEKLMPVYQGVDSSFLVATLTAAIQEQQAIIESLKARLDAANL